jgi:hypothetical protein
MVGIDGVMAGVLTASGLATLGDNSSAAAIPLIAAGLYTLSAVHGNSVVNDCRDEIAAYDRLNGPHFAEDEQPAAGRWSKAEITKAVAKRKAVDTQEAAQVDTGPPPAAPPAPKPPEQKPPDPKPPAAPPAPPKPTDDPWADFWKEQQP